MATKLNTYRTGKPAKPAPTVTPVGKVGSNQREARKPNYFVNSNDTLITGFDDEQEFEEENEDRISKKIQHQS